MFSLPQLLDIPYRGLKVHIHFHISKFLSHLAYGDEILYGRLLVKLIDKI